MACPAYNSIEGVTSYTEAIRVLDARYIKPTNIIYARHKLATRKQKVGEPLSSYIENLRSLASECEFAAVTDEQNRNDCIRDAFITGINSPHIRQRLLENLTLTLDDAITLAQSLDMAVSHSEAYSTQDQNFVATIETEQSGSQETCDKHVAAVSKQCYFCGSKNFHPRRECRARNATCFKCKTVGHFSSVCKKSRVGARGENTNFENCEVISSIPKTPGTSNGLKRSMVDILINGTQTSALLDTGSSVSLISSKTAKQIGLKTTPSKLKLSFASSNHSVSIKKSCVVDIRVMEDTYRGVALSMVDDLCAPVLLGLDFLSKFSSLNFVLGGPLPPISVCALVKADVPPASLFEHLDPSCHPVASKSRRYSKDDGDFIRSEVKRLISDGIIVPSSSPWRAQVVVVKNAQKKRMVVDYSETINKYTLPNAYPIPRISEIVDNLAKYRYFSRIDLKSAYHQIPIPEEDQHFTAFEAGGALYQFTRIPFGVTNGVACFQEILNKIIASENLKATFAYFDDVTICGDSKEEHDRNLKSFLEAAAKYHLTINKEKSKFSTEKVCILGHMIENHIIQPDPARLRPLLTMPVPTDSKSMKRAAGLFAHYSKWVPNFSDKLQKFIQSEFPLNEIAIVAFEDLKKDIASASLAVIDDNIPFVVETDASDYAIAAVLSQNDRPVAFFSRSLNKSEKSQSSVEKEACAIVEALKYWRHFLMGRRFVVITDQKSVSFIFGPSNKGKIKNEKLLRWKLELGSYCFDIQYRPGVENFGADALSRSEPQVSASVSKLSLVELHDSLGHPGISRLHHFVRTKNLPYSMEDVKKIVSNCKVCAQIKPNFYEYKGTLIKSTRPLQRISIDFKGPLPSVSNNKYLLTVIDEFSRFPFAFPVSDVSTQTVIKCLCSLFCLAGMPENIHTDRGTAFMSEEFRTFLVDRGVSLTHSTPYNPRGNSQVERLNGTIWRTIQLYLKNQGLEVKNWESVLSDSLHSIRSLLCTAINETPHERFFLFNRKTSFGVSMPSWLLNPGRVLLKKHVRTSKYEPLVEEVDLVETNPNFATVRNSNGRESTVSLRHLAPLGTGELRPQSQLLENSTFPEGGSNQKEFPVEGGTENQTVEKDTENSIVVPELRRSSRISKHPDRLQYH